MKELCGAEITSEIIDCYPHPEEKTRISLKKKYLTKLSGKIYADKAVTSILEHLNFDIIQQSEEEITAAVPFNKPDMSVAADLVEEIMRIDGYGSVDIPTHIHIAPSTRSQTSTLEPQKEKIAAYLTDNGFYEIM